MGMLGLRVSITKTEALLFLGPRKGPPRGASITVQVTVIKVQAQMKYLGLILDGRWSFGQYFVQLGPRLINAAAALGRLLPNVVGPGSLCRRLYAGVVRSMALYGAPIWVDDLTTDFRALLRKPQRVIAVRGIRGNRGDRPGSACWAKALIVRWEKDLRSTTAGLAKMEAIRPHLSRWVKKKYGTLSYRMTQLDNGTGGKLSHSKAYDHSEAYFRHPNSSTPNSSLNS
nr:uncharacterized protein LOC113401845 [Vanessa tameamea]